MKGGHTKEQVREWCSSDDSEPFEELGVEEHHVAVLRAGFSGKQIVHVQSVRQHTLKEILAHLRLEKRVPGLLLLDDEKLEKVTADSNEIKEEKQAHIKDKAVLVVALVCVGVEKDVILGLVQVVQSLEALKDGEYVCERMEWEELPDKIVQLQRGWPRVSLDFARKYEKGNFIVWPDHPEHVIGKTATCKVVRGRYKQDAEQGFCAIKKIGLGDKSKAMLAGEEERTKRVGRFAELMDQPDAVLVTKYGSCGNLEEGMQKWKPLNEQLARQIVKQVAEEIAGLHSGLTRGEKFAHRDVKGRNVVMFCNCTGKCDGRWDSSEHKALTAKLIDFEGLTSEAECMKTPFEGTHLYRWRSDLRSFEEWQASDWYAFGVIVMDMLQAIRGDFKVREQRVNSLVECVAREKEDSHFVKGMLLLANDLISSPMEMAAKFSVVDRVKLLVETPSQETSAQQVQTVLFALREQYSDFKMEGFDAEEDMSKLKLDTGFVKLSIAKWNKAGQEQALKGDKESFWDMLEKKLEKVELPNIWNNKNRRRVVVQGAAGAGKTTLLRWIAYEWSRGLLWKDKFEAVVFLKLRHIGEDCKCMEDVLLSGFGWDETKRELVREFLKWTKEHCVLWLLDGWDEISVKDGAALQKIQNGEPLDEGRVEFLIAGSRPEAVNSILQVEKDSVLLVQGFTDEGIWRFVRRYNREWSGYEAATTLLLCMKRVYGNLIPKQLRRRITEAVWRHQEEEGKETTLVRSLLKSGWLRDACHSPLMLRFVCLVAPQLTKVERVNRTIVYKLVVDHFMKRAAEGKLRKEVRDQLAEIAWRGYSSRDLLVSENELLNWSCFELLTKCGLLRSEGAVGTESHVFSWVHFTIQEYLAAEQICSDRFKGDLVTELERCLAFENRNVFVGFVCGIEGEKNRPVDWWGHWYPKEFEGIGNNDDLEDFGPVVWIDEGGTNLEAALVVLWKPVFETAGGALLRTAAMHGWKRVVKFLIPFCKVDARSRSGETALMLSSFRGCMEIVKCLLDHKANVDAVDEDGMTALTLAAKSGHLETVKCLLDHGANVNDVYVMCVAAFEGRTEIVKWLLEYGVAVDARDEHGWSALMLAAGNGRTETVKCLLNHRALANAVNEYGGTALMEAAVHGHKETIECLLDSGAHANASTQYGHTALNCAAENGYAEIVKCLLVRGAHANAVNDYGGTGLMSAAARGHTETVKCLLDHKAEVDAMDGEDGRTALMDAAMNGHTGTVKCLLEYRANVNAVTKSGKTALHFACKEGHEDIVKLLQDHGAIEVEQVESNQPKQAFKKVARNERCVTCRFVNCKCKK